jgi:hypothetical protein
MFCCSDAFILSNLMTLPNLTVILLNLAFHSV